MPLLEFWESNPTTVEKLTIEQVVTNAGDGSLRDGSECSQELRKFFARVSSTRIASYVEDRVPARGV